MSALVGITKNGECFTWRHDMIAHSIDDGNAFEKGSSMAESKSNVNVSRGNFLRAMALAGTGLGLSALSACGSKGNVSEKGRQGYVVAVTHGLKDPTRVMLAL